MILKFFEEICKIPHGSRKEKAISDYLYRWAKERNLFVIQDDALNILIKKDATKGYENSKPVILQGHMDMVCEKNMDTEHDFLTDPIKTYVEDGFLKARGTTLGADNGIALAMAMDILDRNDLEHPPLEVLFTTEEEVGLRGAQEFDVSLLNGKYFINIDSEEEGEFLASCAGGLRVDLALPVELISKPQGFIEYNLYVKGLIGGHSGMEIDSGRANSIVLLGRVLDALREEDFYISEIFGGSLDNAIPREACAVISVNQNSLDRINGLVEKISRILKKEYEGIDDGLNLIFEKHERAVEQVFTKEASDKIIAALNLLPNGVSNMSKDLIGLVETSNNIGVMKTENDSVIISSAVRSSVSSRKQMIVNKFKNMSLILGGEITIRGDYPGWEYQRESWLREVFLETYKELFDKDGIVKAIHAGLECGIFAEQMDIDVISLGPDIFNAHNPDEKMSIASVENTFQLIVSVLKKLK